MDAVGLLLRPANIRAHWPFVREGIEKTKALRGGTYRPEDVYAACVNREAFLYLADEGFVILKPIMDDYSLERILLVWLVWGAGDADLIAKYQAHIVAIAKAEAFDRIQFYRHAKGSVESGGWTKRYTIYEMDL